MRGRALQARGRVPFRNATTAIPDEAAALHTQHALVLRLFAEPARLRAIPVAPPPYWELKALL